MLAAANGSTLEEVKAESKQNKEAYESLLAAEPEIDVTSVKKESRSFDPAYDAFVDMAHVQRPTPV